MIVVSELVHTHLLDYSSGTYYLIPTEVQGNFVCQGLSNILKYISFFLFTFFFWIVKVLKLDDS